MSKPARRIAAKQRIAAKTSGEVEAVFNAYPKPLRARLLALRRLIFATAKATPGVGALQETVTGTRPEEIAAAQARMTSAEVAVDKAQRDVDRVLRDLQPVGRPQLLADLRIQLVGGSNHGAHRRRSHACWLLAEITSPTR